MKYLFTHLEGVVARNLPDFVGYDEVAQLVETISPAELRELRAQAGKRTALTTVCKALLAEEASLSPFAAVYDAFQRSYSAGAGVKAPSSAFGRCPSWAPGWRGISRDMKPCPSAPITSSSSGAQFTTPVPTPCWPWSQRGAKLL